MSEALRARLARLERLLGAARKIADPMDELGRRARGALCATSLLSAEGVELALERCLEANPTRGELRALCDVVPSTRRAHVLLSANVLTGAHRAIAVALAASADVSVRPSRREPVLAELLCEATGDLFRLTDELAPEAGDHVWAYGREETLHELRENLPPGSVLHAHGPGIGVAVVQPRDDGRDIAAAARALAEDVLPFDQRGCSSPRLALVAGNRAAAEAFARELAAALAQAEKRVPRGRLESEEAADVTRYRDALTYALRVLPAGEGCVSLDVEGKLVLVPPVGRNVHVLRVDVLEPSLAELAPAITAIGFAGPSALEESVARVAPRARLSGLGRMQSPPLDGPVDRRTAREGEVVAAFSESGDEFREVRARGRARR
jgi:hypothetical protein